MAGERPAALGGTGDGGLKGGGPAVETPLQPALHGFAAEDGLRRGPPRRVDDYMYKKEEKI